jgi:GMP reductase
MHRWSSTDEDTNIDDVVNFAGEMYKSKNLCSISIGVSEKWINALKGLKDFGHVYPNFITVDVAHADHENTKGVMKFIKKELPDTKLIVGNVATAEGCEYLIKLGADAIKIGIGGGSICSTAHKTGFHVPMFSCCLMCAPICEKYDIPFIADGGIEECGDIAKALTAGATMIMAGGLFAGCIDSPAEIVNGYKQYRGSTSYEMKGVKKHIEGKKIEIVQGIKYSERLEEVKQALASSISYAGGKDINAFNLVEYIII